MTEIRGIDPDRKIARVQSGVICDQLRNAAKRFNQTFAPDPATHNHCTLGDMIGHDSCGVHSVTGGKTSDNVVELEILTDDGLRMSVGRTLPTELERIIEEGGRKGEIYRDQRDVRARYGSLVRSRFPTIPRRVSGYNLDALLPERHFNLAEALVGTEGTCVTVLEATVRLMWDPPAHTLVVLGYPDGYQAADHVPEVLSFGPIGLEGFEHRMIEAELKKNLRVKNMRLLPEGQGWLLVEFGGETRAEADDKAYRLLDYLRKRPHPPTMKLYDDARGGAYRLANPRVGGGRRLGGARRATDLA
jgi:FAD/FMN-containing dehydrogenase